MRASRRETRGAPGDRQGTVAGIGVPLLAGLLGLVARAITAPTLFASDRTHLPFAGDAYYHLRRIQYTVAHFPDTLSLDPYVSYPNGGEIFWPPLFDWTIAGFIRLVAGEADPHTVESIAVWVPAVLGAATAAAIGWLALRVFGLAAGVLAGVVFAFLPASEQYSRIGMIDHHVAVALLSVGVLAGLHALLERLDGVPGDDLRLASGLPEAVALGAVHALLLLTWPGGLLHLAMTQLVLGVWWLGAPERAASVGRGRLFVAVHATLFVLVTPFSYGNEWREYGSWSPMVLNDFQPAYLGAATIVAAFVVALHARTGTGGARSLRAASAGAITVVVAAAVFGAIEELRDAFLGAGSWFASGHPLLGSVNEMRPLLAPYGELGLWHPIARFGALVLAFPVLLVVGAIGAWRDARAGRLALYAWGGGFLLLTLAQWRFMNTFAVPYALLTGAALGELWSRARSGPRSPWLVATGILAVALSVWSGHRFWTVFSERLAEGRAAWSDPAVAERGPLVAVPHRYAEAGDWIREHTPGTRGFDDPSIQPEYGIVTHWATGHLLRYRSQRPMVADNFGPFAGLDAFDEGWRYFAEVDEEAAIERLERVGARYVVADARGSGVGERGGRDTMGWRLSRGWGSRKVTGESLEVPGLARHRLIYHTYDRRDPRSRRRPRSLAGFPRGLGVWEIVPGAAIEGRADPGRSVRLGLSLVTHDRTSHLYARRTIADGEGRYRLVVPYPTDQPWSPALRSLGRYRMTDGTRTIELDVPEQDVATGGRVEGPDFTVGDAAS